MRTNQNRDITARPPIRRISDSDASPAIAPAAMTNPNAATNNQNPAPMVSTVSAQRGRATNLILGPFASALRTPALSQMPDLEGRLASIALIRPHPVPAFWGAAYAHHRPYPKVRRTAR